MELYREERGLSTEVVQTTGLWRHPEVEWLAASPDRLIGDTMLLEVKTMAQIGAPTSAFLIQIVIQLACAQRSSCDLAQFSYKTRSPRRLMRSANHNLGGSNVWRIISANTRAGIINL